MKKEGIPTTKNPKGERIKEIETTLAEIAEREKNRAEKEKKRIERDKQAREDIKRATKAAEKLSGTKIPETPEEIEIPKKLTDEEIIGELKNLPEKEIKNPETAEEVEVEKEIKNLPLEDREKIKFGLNTFGFWAKKKKDDFFANTFDRSLEKKDENGKIIQKGFNQKGTTGRFCTELRDYFIRNSKDAEKKANDASAFSDTKIGINIGGKKRGINISAGKQKTMSNIGAFSGNVLKYGRLVYDATGITIGAANRVAMAVGMATTVLAEAGKETRLKNEEVIEKTRIQDVDRAYEEFWKIHENALAKEGKGKEENVSVEALKNAYLMEMPKDLQERLKNPSTANNFIQRRLRDELLGYEIKGHVVFEGAISRLNKKIEKLESDNNLIDEERKIEIEKLITKQKKNLEDYDRIITQYGTIDGMAMALRYAQTAGKATVAVLQVETLFITADKICETFSNVYHHFHDAHEILTPHISAPKGKTIVPPPSAPTTPTAPSALVHPQYEPGPFTFANEGIKFEHGKGGIQGILDLKKQILTQYNGDYSKAPESVRDFMDTDPTKEAIKLGLYDPNNPNESALIREGSILKFDDKGSLIFHDTKTGEDVTHYAGKMFDSDGSAKISTAEHIDNPSSEPETPDTPASKSNHILDPETEKQIYEEAEKNKKDIADMFAKKSEPIPKTEAEITTKPTPTELKAKIIEQIDLNKPGLGYQKVSVGTQYNVGSEMHTGSEVDTGSPLKTGSPLETGSSVGTGSWVGVGSEGYYGGQQYNGNLSQDPLGQYHDMGDSGKIVFPELSSHENAILQNHPEFAYNPFGLPAKELIHTFQARNEDIEYVFRGIKSTWTWDKLGDLKTGKILEYGEGVNSDPAITKLSQYLNLLKNFTGLEPKKGFLGMGSESSEYYIARALQALEAGKGKVNLEEFQAILRK